MTPKSCPGATQARLGYNPATAGLPPSCTQALPGYTWGTPGARQRYTAVTPGLHPGYTQVAPEYTEVVPMLRPGYAECPCGLPNVTLVGLVDGDIGADYVDAGEGKGRWMGITVSPI